MYSDVQDLFLSAFFYRRKRFYNIFWTTNFPNFIGQNICRHFYTLPQYYLTTSENGTRLLSSICQYTSCLTSCRTPQHFESLGIQGNPWKTWNWWQMSRMPPKRQSLTVVLQNWKKSAVKVSMEKPVLLHSVNLQTIFFPRFYQ